jgi:ribosomal-protein-alanine acetyltransferase
MDVALRRMRPEDRNEVQEIEREAFAPLGVGTPFKREMNNRYAKYLVAYFPEPPNPQGQPEPPIQGDSSEPADVPIWSRMLKSVQALVKQDNQTSTEQESSIAGYLGVWFQGTEAHITEIAVREPLRGQGIGELLLIGSLHAALEYGSSVVTLEARVSNFVAHRLYEKYGFKSSGVRKGYYADNREDAVIMTTSPIHTEAYRELFRELQEKYPARWREIRIED